MQIAHQMHVMHYANGQLGQEWSAFITDCDQV